MKSRNAKYEFVYRVTLDACEEKHWKKLSKCCISFQVCEYW